MNPVYIILKRYAPIVTLPIAIVIGGIGYACESYFREKRPQAHESFSEKREERRFNELTQGDVTKIPKVTENHYSKNTVLDRQLSPSLSKD